MAETVSEAGGNVDQRRGADSGQHGQTLPRADAQPRKDDDQGNRGKEADQDEKGGKKDEKEKDSEENDEDDDKKGDEKDGDKKRSKLPFVIGAVVMVLLIAAGVFYYFSIIDQETTDDAYTEGNAVGIAPHVSGYVIERFVDDNQFVRTGDLMLRIDPRDYITARDQARANLDLALAQRQTAQVDLEIARVRYPADRQQALAQLEQARANQTNAARDFQRQRTVDPRATTQTAVDQATAQYQSASATVRQIEAQLQVSSLVGPNIEATATTVKQRDAQVEQARANLAQAELNLAFTEIRAPQDGKVTRRNVEVGTYAQAGQQVFYVTSPITWVVANFKETQLTRMRPGQKVDLNVDAYPGLKVRGHIDSIQQGAGARFTTFPSENATGNFVKIVRRVPVKIVIDSGIDPQQGLPLGLSVEPTVYLK